MNTVGIYITLFLLCFSYGNGPRPNVQLLPESWITIEGRSNVNTFLFEYTFKDYANELDLKISVGEDQMTIHPYTLRLPIIEFENHNRILRQDFRETLKYKMQPEIVIQVDSLQFTEVDCGDHGKIHTEVMIGGVSRTETIDYQIQDNHDGILNMKGHINLDMACYELDIQKKFMGLIQIDQIVNINLLLNFDVE